MKIGYARVSTKHQKLDMQLDALEKENCEKIFSEEVSTRKPLLELESCISHLREGDTLVVYKLDRLGRKSSELMVLYERLLEMGVHLQSIKENIDSSTPMGKAMIQMLFVFAEMEREVMAEKRNDGIQAARARGRKGGRPPMKTKQIEQAVKMYDSRDFTIVEITKATGVSQTSLYKHINKRKKEQEEKAAKEFTKA